MDLPEQELRRAIEAAEQQLGREEQQLCSRIRVSLKILLHAGYAMVGGTFFDRVVNDRPLLFSTFAWTTVGLATLGLVVFLAPRGDGPDA